MHSVTCLVLQTSLHTVIIRTCDALLATQVDACVDCSVEVLKIEHILNSNRHAGHVSSLNEP